MAAYIDIDYYKNTWMGTDPDDDVLLQKLINRSSDIIDFLTRNRITDFDALYSIQQDNVKKATAAQTEYLVSVGENYNTDGSIQSAKIGNFSYTEGAKGAEPANSMDQSVSKLARQYLAVTSLAYGGVACG